MDDINSDDWNSMLSNVDLKDSSQAQVAASITTKFINKDKNGGDGDSDAVVADADAVVIGDIKRTEQV